MLIKNKTVFVYDIEIFPNVFHAVVKDTETGIKVNLEISQRKNDLVLIEQMFHLQDKDWDIQKYLIDDKIFCGYNNHHYDDVIINYILEYYNTMKHMTNERITQSLFNLSSLIVNGDDDSKNKWKHWKYLHYFDSIDLLTMHFSSKLRVGLKEMQVTMKYNNVQEYEGDFTKVLPLDQIDEMVKYNSNDVDSTEYLLNLSKKDIDLRLGIEQEYGIDVLSLDGVGIGKEILKIRYLQDTKQTWNDIKDLRSPCDMVNLKDVILPIIEFRSPILTDLLTEMKSLTVSPGRDGWNKKFVFHDTTISIGVGGIHSVNTPEIIKPQDDEILLDADAASLYPSLLIEWNFAPIHLGNEFLQTYSNIKTDRIEAKHNGNKVKNMTLKLALNAVTGLMQSEYSWLYSPKDVMRIRMNGQLLLLMLAERLIDATGCRVIQYNTDGIFILMKRNQLETYAKVVAEFEKISRLQFEAEEFEAFYQFAINDYIAVGKGFAETQNLNLVKLKGMFITDVLLGKGMDAKIIPEAIVNYFLYKTPVRNTVRQCKDLHKFLTYQKVDKKFTVFYGDQKVTRINRYYYSTNGNYLTKCDLKDALPKYIKLDANSPVTIVNNIMTNQLPTNINYLYYEKQANDIIQALQWKQLSLF